MITKIDLIKQPQFQDVLIDYGVFPINCIRLHQQTETVRIEVSQIDELIKVLQAAKKHFK